MKIKTSELTDAALDWAVAIAQGIPAEDMRIPSRGGSSLFRYLRDEEGNLDGRYMTGPDLLFSTKWEAGGPIIERSLLVISPDPTHNWRCTPYMDTTEHYGPTPLIAAMRCYVASNLGDEIEIPDELVS